MKDTKKIVIAALMAAFTCIATMIIKFQTPTFGYIHLGDGLVLLCGILLGPWYGALAAGIGSMFADIFSGYVTWAPATLVIKAVVALLAGTLFHKLQYTIKGKSSRYISIIIGGVVGEIFMVIGYFFYEVFLAACTSGSINRVSLAAGMTSSATGIPFNIVQGVVGIIISLLLLPFLLKVEEIREWIAK